jgi:hypothetical protein
MANANPPKKNQAFVAYVTLEDYNNPGMFKINPTLAAGDCKVQTDNGALTNTATAADVDPDSGYSVKISLSAGEMNGDNIVVMMKDQTSPPEWCDLVLSINTTA